MKESKQSKWGTRRNYLHVNFICHGYSQLDGPSTYSVAIWAFKNKTHNTGTNKAKEKLKTSVSQ